MNNDNKILELIKNGRVIANPLLGMVYSIKSNRPNKPMGAVTKKGYLRTCISFNGMKIYMMLHRVIWIFVNGVPLPGLQIDHINGQKTDNRISNLHAVIGKENMRRAAVMGLTNGGWRNAPRNKKGQYIGKAKAGRLLDGREWNQMPEVKE